MNKEQIEKDIIQTEAAYQGRVYYPKGCRNVCYIQAVLSALCLAVLLYLILAQNLNENITGIIILMVVAASGSLMLAIGYTRFEILVKEDHLMVTPMFQKMKRIKYDQITEVRYSGMAKTLVLSAGKKRVITVENYAVGYNDLCDLFRSKGKLN